MLLILLFISYVFGRGEVIYVPEECDGKRTCPIVHEKICISLKDEMTDAEIEAEELICDSLGIDCDDLLGVSEQYVVEDGKVYTVTYEKSGCGGEEIKVELPDAVKKECPSSIAYRYKTPLPNCENYEYFGRIQLYTSNCVGKSKYVVKDGWLQDCDYSDDACTDRKSVV